MQLINVARVIKLKINTQTEINQSISAAPFSVITLYIDELFQASDSQ